MEQVGDREVDVIMRKTARLAEEVWHAQTVGSFIPIIQGFQKFPNGVVT